MNLSIAALAVADKDFSGILLRNEVLNKLGLCDDDSDYN
jgi:hypothetical protein